LYVLVEATSPVPNIDVAKTCRAAEKAITDIFKDSTAANFESCMRAQREARDNLVKDWTTYSAPDRARCINPSDYMPSYVEWLSCLETAKAVQDIRRRP